MTLIWGGTANGRNYTDEQLAEFKAKHGIKEHASEWDQMMADAKKRIAERAEKKGE